jgi:hypothetical protein
LLPERTHVAAAAVEAHVAEVAAEAHVVADLLLKRMSSLKLLPKSMSSLIYC